MGEDGGKNEEHESGDEIDEEDRCSTEVLLLKTKAITHSGRVTSLMLKIQTCDRGNAVGLLTRLWKRPRVAV